MSPGWFDSLWKKLVVSSHRRRNSGSAGPVGAEVMKAMVGTILSTREDEIDCDRCFEVIDLFVDLKVKGEDESVDETVSGMDSHGSVL